MSLKFILKMKQIPKFESFLREHAAGNVVWRDAKTLEIAH